MWRPFAAHLKLVDANGDVYDGEWKDDKPDGYGIYDLREGSKYIGEFKANKQHGYGREIWPDYEQYFVSWRLGKRLKARHRQTNHC